MTEHGHRLETVPRPQWRETCSHFRHRHQGWMIRVIETPRDRGAVGNGGATRETEAHPAVSPSELPARELVSDVVLHDLVFADAEGTPQLTLVITDSGGSETSLSIQPQAILLERQGDADAGIRFEERNGDRIQVLFRVPALPEALDGLAAGER